MSFQPDNYWFVSETKHFFYGKITVVNSFTRNLNVKQLLFCRIGCVSLQWSKCQHIKCTRTYSTQCLLCGINTHTQTELYDTRYNELNGSLTSKPWKRIGHSALLMRFKHHNYLIELTFYAHNETDKKEVMHHDEN